MKKADMSANRKSERGKYMENKDEKKTKGKKVRKLYRVERLQNCEQSLCECERLYNSVFLVLYSGILSLTIAKCVFSLSPSIPQ